MKNRKKALFLVSSVFLICNGLLHAREGHKEDPHYVWFEGDEVAVEEDGIYADSNKGMFKLNSPAILRDFESVKMVGRARIELAT